MLLQIVLLTVSNVLVQRAVKHANPTCGSILPSGTARVS